MLIHTIPSSKYNKYFTTFGKSLAIAEKFEDSCRFILQTALIENGIHTGDLNLIDLLDSNSKKGKDLRGKSNGSIAKNLGRRLVENGILSDFVIQKLILAIDSRNWIAHEALTEVSYSFGSPKIENDFSNALHQLKSHIENIAIGEYICGAIHIEMNDKTPFYDPDKQKYYAQKLIEWAFDDHGKIKDDYNILKSYFYEIKRPKSRPPTSK